MIFRRLAPLLLGVFACSSPAPAPPVAAVPGGAVALCAGKSISAAAISEVSAAQRTSSRQALEALAHDARFATEAEQRGLGESPDVQGIRKAILARTLLQQLKQSNHSPPTTAEISALRKERWRDFDRPEGARVIHALARGDDARARKIAEAIAAATAGARDAADFETRATGVEHDGIEVRVEKLSMMTRDGRSLEDEGSFVVPFAEAALALKAAGSISPITKTEFGYHVIFLIERGEAYRPTDEELAKVAGEELLSRRWHQEERRLIAQLREQQEVMIARNAGELTKTLQARPTAP